MLFNVSLGPTGGDDSNANDISLSRNIISIQGIMYFFFVSIMSFTIYSVTIYHLRLCGLSYFYYFHKLAQHKHQIR